MRLKPQRHSSPPTGDDAVAAVVGVIIVLAVLITAYSNAVHTEVPAFGADAERSWDDAVGDAFRGMGESLSAGLTTGTPMARTVPPPPDAQALEIPFLGRRTPSPPSGVVAFASTCASLTASHEVIEGRSIRDLTGGASGCLTFRGEPVYSNAFSYRIEFGGVMRLQEDRAVVLSGPALAVDASDANTYRVTLGVPALRGDTASASADAGVRVDLVPGPFASDVSSHPNAANVTWQLDTPYAQAWKTWFETRFQQAGLVAPRASPGTGQSSADYSVACAPLDCSRGAGGLGSVIVRIEGPRTDSNDLRLSTTYGIFDVNVR